MKNSHTTVRVEVDTHDRLEDVRKKGECYDETIRRLLAGRSNPPEAPDSNEATGD